MFADSRGECIFSCIRPGIFFFGIFYFGFYVNSGISGSVSIGTVNYMEAMKQLMAGLYELFTNKEAKWDFSVLTDHFISL